MIRKAHHGDLSRMQAIEVSAGDAFRDLGMDFVADDPPLSSTALAAYADAGMAWVATNSFDYPAAYILVSEIDGWGHIDQVSVHARYARQRLGQALIEEVGRWTAITGLQGISLTTFADVPWNGPYYARLGFVPVPEDCWSQGLRSVVAEEARQGLDAWPRVVMKLPLSGVK
jgi:GNAT superfamily N-acetyltransferase